jgi:predicted ATPase/DNA-binding CsgD family transcriptional regulator
MKGSHDTSVLCPVMIGRTEVLATLRSLTDTVKNGNGSVVLVSGEAGIGKSRLVAEVTTYAAAQGFLLVQGRCFPTDLSCPYAPLLDLLHFCVTSHIAAPAAPEVEALAQVFLPVLPEMSQVLAARAPSAPLPPLDGEPEKRRRFETLAHFLTHQALAHPLLLVVEDLHWSDDASLEFLHYLARRCSAHSLLLVLTYRSDEVHPGLGHLLAQLDRERLAQEYSLDHLTQKEVQAMLQAIFALPRSTRLEFFDALYALTEGNPFFVEEVLKTFVARGELFYTHGRWERTPLGELHIPRSVQDAVQQRTRQLAESARQVATLAAVAGRRFDFGLLRHLTGYDEPHLLQAIKALITAQLVVEESAEQFAFRHALTRQAIYADLLGRERQALHHRIADTMEGIYISTALRQAHLADLAYHFYEAGEWAKALDYGQRAGEQAQRLYTPRAVVEQATRALDAAQRGSLSPPAQLYRLRGQAYETLGDFEHAQMEYETALQMARVAGDAQGEWQALMDLGFLWAERDYAQTGALYQQALLLARHMDNPITLAHTLNRLGNWSLNIEQSQEALRHHQEALTLFEQARDAPGIAATYDLLGMTATLGGDLLQATGYYRQAIALFEELDDRQGLASSLATLMVLGKGGCYETETIVSAPTSFAESLQCGERAIQTARAIGQRSAEAYALLALAQYLGPHGEYARALEVAREGLALAEQIEHHEWLTFGHWQVGALYFDLLALPEAQQHLEQALALAQEIGSWNWIRIVTGFLARLVLLQGDFARAESLLNAALASDAPSQTIGQRIIWDARAALALAGNNPPLALDIIDRLIATSANLSSKQVIPHLWKARGETLAALGRGVEAEAALQAAQATAQAQGLKPLLWRIALALGHLYHAQARKAESEQAFATAQTLIEELAASLPDEALRETFLSSALRRLPRPHPLTPRRAIKQTFGGLTTREREVAVLIAQGHTNQAIAEQLVLSERTVEGHVTNILSKLGGTTRTQIATWAIEKGLAGKDE